MAITSTPLPLGLELLNTDLERQVTEILDAIPKDAEPGGMTIGRNGRARTLVYKGPFTEGTDERVRNIVKPLGFNVSTIRNEDQLDMYQTRTSENPNP